MAFTNILPDPTHKINAAGQADAGGVGGPGYAAIKLESEAPMLNSMFNSQRYSSNSNNYHTWKISIEYNPLTCEEFHTIFAFIVFACNNLEPFYVSIPPYDQQTLIGLTLTTTMIEKTETLDVDGTGAAPGMIFTLAGNPKVYKITRVETETSYDTAVAAGKERLHITPPLVEDTNTGTALNFIDVMFKVDVISDENNYSLNKDGLFEYSLTLEETP